MSSADITTKKTIVLTSSDGETFEVEEAVAFKSETIKKIIEDSFAYTPIPLPNVNSKILAKVIEYCKYHTEAAANAAVYGAAAKYAAEAYVREFDTEFVKVDQSTLFGVIVAADFLGIKSLTELMCRTVADMIRGKTVEELRKTFNTTNDLSPEEEEEFRRENAWAFEATLIL